MIKYLTLYLLSFSVLTLMRFISCGTEQDEISEKEFIVLMKNVAEGWSTQNTDLALSSFTQDATYMEPPNVQYYKGHAQLRPYFDELNATHKMEFHNLWFNEKTQKGVGEFTFSYGKDTADVGIIVVEIDDTKIAFWREYHKKGPRDFQRFLDSDNKVWQWHIGNYPEPRDTLGSK